jgi:ring-1,2-phenylacetyl-CoA epoxidase subunit PaaD
VLDEAALARVRTLVGDIPDPEIPVVTLADLGIVREVGLRDGGLRVVLTPTYSGCPATEAIRDQVRAVLAGAGHADARVDIVLSPAWSTDWIGDAAREKLRAYGIAPPARSAADGCGLTAGSRAPIRVVGLRPRAAASADTDAQPECPRCGSGDVEQLSRYGSTPCKALYRCRACAEPFDYFKPY